MTKRLRGGANSALALTPDLTGVAACPPLYPAKPSLNPAATSCIRIACPYKLPAIAMTCPLTGLY